MGWYERYDSRAFSVSDTTSSIELKFVADGSEDEATIYNTIAINAPATFPVGTRILFRQDYDAEPLGGGIWDVSVRYGLVDLEESVFNFDTTGARTHITQSLEVELKVPAAAPDVGGAIGFDGERVQGIDIPIPKFSWNERHKFLATNFTPAYRLVLRDLTSRWNQASFRGFNPGEVQFMGATGSQRGFHDLEITYYFDSNPNRTNITVGPLNVNSKRGFDYLDVRYKKVEDLVNFRVRTEPDFAYVHRVFDAGNFNGLGIGT